MFTEGAFSFMLEFEISFKASTLNTSYYFQTFIHSAPPKVLKSQRTIRFNVMPLGKALTLVGLSDGNSNAYILYHNSRALSSTAYVKISPDFVKIFVRVV